LVVLLLVESLPRLFNREVNMAGVYMIFGVMVAFPLYHHVRKVCAKQR